MEHDDDLLPRWNLRFWGVQTITTIRLVMALGFLVVVGRLEREIATVYYVAMLLTDVLDGALARRLGVATVGGDWYDTLTDRVVNLVSMIYGVMAGAPPVACALVMARELLVAAMLGIGPEPPVGAVRFLGFVAGIPLRFVTAVIVVGGGSVLIQSLVPTLYWTTALLSIATIPPKLAHVRNDFASAFRRRHRAPLIG